MENNEIKETIEGLFGLDDIHLKTRKTDYVIARGLFNYTLSNLKFIPKRRIGIIYGYNHSTIINSINSFKQLMDYKNEYTSRVNDFFEIYNNTTWEEQK